MNSKVILTLAAALLAILVCAGSAAARQEGGKALLEQKKYAEAEQAFLAALEAAPDNHAARVGLGEARLWLGKFADAEHAASLVLDAQPNNSDAIWVLAQALKLQADDLRINSEIPSNLAIRTRYNDAEKQATRLLEADPSRNDVRIFRGDTRFWLEDLDGAAEDYLAALEQDPTNVDLMYTVGDLAARYQGEYAKAIPYLQNAITARKEFFEAHVSLALAHLGMENSEAAIDNFVEALRIRPNDAETYQTIWDLFGKKQQYEEALDVYARILEENPENFMAHWHRAFVFEQQGRYKEALAECDTILEKRPDWLDVRTFMAGIRIKQEDKDSASSEWLAILDADPENPEAMDALLGLARAYGSAGEYDKALAQFDELTRRFPEVAAIHADRALTLFNMNRTEEAIQAYEDAARIDPFDSQILNDTGLVYQGVKDYSKAIEMFMKAIELDGNLDAQENYAVLLFKLQETRQATNRFEKILAEDGTRARSLKYYLQCRRILDLESKTRKAKTGK